MGWLFHTSHGKGALAESSQQSPLGEKFTMPQNPIMSITAIGSKNTPFPLDTPLTLGSFSVCVTSGTMAAGLAGASPILAFLWKPAVVTTSQCIVRRIKFAVNALGTAFAAGELIFDFLVARAFTVQDTGGGA